MYENEMLHSVWGNKSTFDIYICKMETYRSKAKEHQWASKLYDRESSKLLQKIERKQTDVEFCE